jgi:antitoxin MazE
MRKAKGLAKTAGLREGDRVDLTSKESAVVIRRARPRYTLGQLLASMTPENVHPEVEWGGPVGRERFWEGQSALGT